MDKPSSEGRGTRYSNQMLPRDYLSSLKAYWEWKPRIAISRLTTSISLDTCKSDIFSLYRLWIEVLANSGERHSLMVLAEHFSFSLEKAPDNQTTFAALKALVHFELDEIEASKLLHRTIKHQNSNPFVWELSYRLSQRFASKPLQSGFHKNRELLRDYFHLKTYACAALMQEDQEEINWTRDKFKTLYPASPILDLTEIHGHLDRSEYKKAIPFCLRIAERFPQNLDFQFNLGYVLAKSGEYLSAIKEFEKVVELFDEQDPDVLNWLGFCLANQAINKEDPLLREKSAQILNKSVKISLEMGVPISFPKRTLFQLDKKFGIDPDNKAVPKIWLIKVDHQHFHKIRTAKLDQITFIEKTLSKEARAGDICLIFGEDYDPKNMKWRFGAIYTVDSDPLFSPKYRFLHQLTLLHRPNISVPILVEEFGTELTKRSSFEVEVAAFEDICDSISAYMEGSGQEIYQNLKSEVL